MVRHRDRGVAPFLRATNRVLCGKQAVLHGHIRAQVQLDALVAVFVALIFPDKAFLDGGDALWYDGQLLGETVDLGIARNPHPVACGKGGRRVRCLFL